MKSYPDFTHRASSAVHLSVRSRLAPGFACFAVAIALSAPLAIAQAPAPGPREMPAKTVPRSEEHTSELQSLTNLACRLLLVKRQARAEQLCDLLLHGLQLH